MQDWKQSLARFNCSSTSKAVWQLINTVLPFLAIMALMTVLVVRDWPYWMVLALALPATGLQIRIFIFFHDCCHGSYFASQRANTITGYLTGILALTPFDSWRHSHNVHHTTSGDLDRRGTGDVWTMTVDEYLSASRRKRLGYRLVRNPFFLLLVVPIWFLIAYRIPGKIGARSVWITNLALAAIITAFSLTVGWQTYLMVRLPVALLAWSAGVWLFYVQHQYEGSYWARSDSRTVEDAALKGSSYYKLPKVLQWMTGNIGLHHIHHLRPRIPNYHLQACQDAVPVLQKVPPLTLRKSLKSLRLNLWDESASRMVGFHALRGRKREPSI